MRHFSYKQWNIKTHINNETFLWSFSGIFSNIKCIEIEVVSNICFYFSLFLKFTTTIKRQLLKMCHLRHRLRIFLFCRKVMFRFKDVKLFFIFNHPIIYQIYDIMMGVTTRCRVRFCIYLLNHNSFSNQTWSTGWYKQGQ